MSSTERPGEAVERRIESFREVLLTARGSRFYPPWLQAASLETPAQIQAVRSVEDALYRLPPVPLRTFVEHREHFRNLRAPRAKGRPPRVEVAPHGWRRTLGFPAEIVAGPFEELRRARVPSTARRLVVRTEIERGPLRTWERDELWDAFGLPVFEELHGFDGEVLARECEAHDGWHVDEEHAFAEVRDAELLLSSFGARRYATLRLRTGLLAALEDGKCACGLAGLRVTILERKSIQRRAAAGSPVYVRGAG